MSRVCFFACVAYFGYCWTSFGVIRIEPDFPSEPLVVGTVRTFRVIDQNNNAPSGLESTQWHFRASGATEWKLWNPSVQTNSVGFVLGAWGDFELRCQIAFMDPGMGQPRPPSEAVIGTFTSLGPNDFVIIAGKGEPTINGDTLTIIYQAMYNGSPVGSQFPGWAQERVKEILGGLNPPAWSNWWPTTLEEYNNQNPRVFYKNMNVILDLQFFAVDQQAWQKIDPGTVFATHDHEIKLITVDWNESPREFSKVFELRRRKVSLTSWQIEAR